MLLATAQNAREYVKYVRGEGLKLKSDPKRFWEFVNKRRSRNDLPSEMTLVSRVARGDDQIANLLAKHFLLLLPTSSYCRARL